MTRTRAEVGRANRERAIATQRDLARYLRFNGWPDAEREPNTGDIRNTPRVRWSVTSTPELTDQKLTQVMRHATDQTAAADIDHNTADHGTVDYGIVVHRRAGKAHPSQWWAYLPLGDLAALLTGQGQPPAMTMAPEPARSAPVRLALADLVELLHHAGYGTREPA